MIDLRIALRALARSPGFTAAAVLTLGAGIGFSTSSFSLANALLLRNLPYPDSERLVRIFRTSPQAGDLPHAPANLADIRAAATSFNGTAVYANENYTLGEPGQLPQQVPLLLVTANFLDVLRVQPAIGRGFTAHEDEPDQPSVVVLTHRGWSLRFAADPHAIGRTIRLNGRQHTIVGVLPATFDAPLVWGQPELLLPLVNEPAFRTRRTGGFMRCIGRLRDDVSRGRAQGELSAIAARLAQDHPKENASAGLRLTDLHDSNFQGTYRLLPWLMTGVSLTMLLLGCANLASLQLARALSGVRDFAVRTALGGSRRQLIVPWIGENLLLAFAGGACGLLIAVWTNDVVGRLLGGVFPLGPIPVDLRVVGFAIAVSIASGMVCSLAPAWFSTRASTVDALKSTSMTATSSKLQRNLKRFLTAATLALAVALLGVAASFGVALQTFLRRPIGWEADGLFSTRIALPASRYGDPAKLREFQRTLLDRLAALPGVERAALAYSLPFYSLDLMGRTASLVVEGQPEPPPGREPAVEATAVSPDYFATLRMPLRAGAAFPADLRSDDPPAVIINQALAHQLWPGKDPIGQRVRFLQTANPLRDTTAWLRVVGVVDDVRMLVRLDAPPTRLQLYRPLTQYSTGYVAIVLRTHVPPETLVQPVKQAVAALDPDLAVGYPGSVREFATTILRNLNVVELNFVISAALGLLIAGVGLFAVVAQLTAQRTRDIGIRMALGASGCDIMRVVLNEGLWLLVAGIAIGVPAFYALNLALSRAVPEMSLPGPWLLALNLVVLAITMLLATWLPARRATRINPVEALRAE